jgi:hypothetical protein
MSFYYAWYWIEREAESYNPKYKRKYDNVRHGNNFIHILKILNKE